MLFCHYQKADLKTYLINLENNLKTNDFKKHYDVLRYDELDDQTDWNSTNSAQKLIRFIGAMIVVLLIIRLILSLFGVDSSTDFAGSIYALTQPLVTPFHGLIAFDGVTANAEFDIATALSIAAITILTALFSNLAKFTTTENKATQ